MEATFFCCRYTPKWKAKGWAGDTVLDLYAIAASLRQHTHLYADVFEGNVAQAAINSREDMAEDAPQPSTFPAHIIGSRKTQEKV